MATESSLPRAHMLDKDMAAQNTNEGRGAKSLPCWAVV